MKKTVFLFIILILLNSNFDSFSNRSEKTPNYNQSINSNYKMDIDDPSIILSASQGVIHDGIISPGEYPERVIIDSPSNFELYYSLNGQIIYIALIVDDIGYVSIGFGSNMAGTDYVIGYYDDGTVVEDGYGPGGVSYEKDAIQNILSSAASENSTSTILEFSRYLDTGDTAQDNVIQLGVQTDLVWASSSTDSFGYHSNRGYATVTFNTFVPLPPENVIAIPSDTKVDLNWAAASDGGSPITNYHIYKSTTPGTYGSSLASVSGDETTYSDLLVTNGETYYYVITSENANGVSSNSNEVSATPSGIITPPQNLQAEISDDQVNLNWQPPTTDGGSPITNYTIYRSSTQGGPYSSIGTNTSTNGYSDNSIINGFTYWYVVTANNAFSESESSNEVSASPIGVPAAPRYVTAILNDNNITVNWIEPISDGGFTISNFSIYRATISGGPYTFLEINSSKTAYFENIVLDLKTYYFVITANNSAGESKYSNELMVKFAKVPFIPENFNIIVAYNQAILNWSAPDDNGYTIEIYSIYRATTDGGPYIKIDSTNKTEYVDLTASNNQQYYYVVTAVNSQGESLYSVQISALPGTIPDVPVNVIGKPNNSQVNLSWLIPQNTGGSEVSNYSIYRSDTHDGLYVLISVINVTHYVDRDLINGQPYYYTISAINVKGEGNKSYPIKVIPGSSPSIPQDVTALNIDGVVNLSWSEVYDGGYRIVEYRIYRSYISGGPYTYLGTNTSKLEYLDNNTIAGVTSYYVISAVNTMGESNFSQEVNISLISIPSSPQNLVAVSGLEQVGLVWDLPNSNGGSQIIKYYLYRSPTADGEFTQIGSTTNISYIDSGLISNQTYYYAVTALNELGESAYSNIVNIKIPEANPTDSISSTPSNGDGFDGLNYFNDKGQILGTLAYFASFALVVATLYFIRRSGKK